MLFLTKILMTAPQLHSSAYTGLQQKNCNQIKFSLYTFKFRSSVASWRAHRRDLHQVCIGGESITPCANFIDLGFQSSLLRQNAGTYTTRPVVLNRGSVEPRGFDEVVSRVRWTLSDILTYYK